MPDFFSKCSPAISNNYDTTGTITRSSVGYPTKDQLESIFKDASGNYRDMRHLLVTQMEWKACGTPTNGFYEWLMSGARGASSFIKPRSVMGGDAEVDPFFLARQKSVINSDFWAVSTGMAASAYGADAATYPLNDVAGFADYKAANGSARIVRVISRHSVPVDDKWFTSKGTVHIWGRLASGAVSRGQWQVVFSAAKSDASYCDILLAPQGSQSGIDTTPGATANVQSILLIGSNNVSDWEKWCYNRPALNPNKNIPVWFQTSRKSFAIDEQYKEYLARMMDRNEYFRSFGEIGIAERNKQQGMMWEKEFCNSFLFNKPLSGQDLTNYQAQLEKVYSYDGGYGHATAGKFVGWRANAEGVYHQLQACSRVIDLANEQLNLQEFFNKLYDLVRSRKASGRPADSIDCYTDSTTAFQFMQAMIQYYSNFFKNSAGTSNAQHMIDTGKLNPMGFNYESYKLPYPQGVTLNILTHNTFDDLASAMSTEDTYKAVGAGNGSAGRFMMILDVGGGIYPAIIGTNRKNYTTGKLEDMAKIDRSYACVMEQWTEDITLMSKTWGVVVECPEDNLWIENFKDIVPDATGTSTANSGTVTDLKTIA